MGVVAAPILKRVKRRAIAIFALVLPVGLAWFGHLAGLWSLPKLLHPGGLPGSAAIWIPVFAGQAYVIVNVQRMRRRLREAEGRVCPACAYDLRGTDASGTCPECGAAYSTESIKLAWKDFDWR